MNDQTYNMVLALLVAVVAATGLIINFVNLPTGAYSGGLPSPDPWVRSVVPTGGDPSAFQLYYDLGADAAETCDIMLTEPQPRPYDTKEITQADWDRCPYDLCVNRCSQLGTPDKCIDFCMAGADRWKKQRYSLFPTDTIPN